MRRTRHEALGRALAMNVDAYRDDRWPELWFAQDFIRARGRKMGPAAQRPEFIRPNPFGSPFELAIQIVNSARGVDMGLRYVEGFCLTDRLPWPIHHAWVTGERGHPRQAIEVLWDRPVLAYRGIVLDAARVAEQRRRGFSSVIYNRGQRINWPFFEEFAGDFIRSEYPGLVRFLPGRAAA